jgi:murein L,D-transpeptidase YcbB/YkuD
MISMLIRGIILVFAFSLASGNQVTPYHQSLWLKADHLTKQASQLLGVLEAAAAYGLQPQDYLLHYSNEDVQLLREGLGGTGLQASFDAALSEVTLRFLRDVRYGRIDPEAAGFHLPVANTRASIDMAAVKMLANSASVPEAVASLEPRPPPYRSLKHALQKYRDLASNPELNVLPTFGARSVQLGDLYLGAPQLRALLTALGDLLPEDAVARAEDVHIDISLAVAVAHFQYRHGLLPDGVIGTHTFAALTLPLQYRVQQLELALERWRWIAATQRPDIVVNLPEFLLYALPRGDHRLGEILEMPIIVGKEYPNTRTPIFMAEIREVVLHPFWDIPSSILRKELLPAIRKDISYLSRHHMEIVRGAGDDADVQTTTPQAIDGLASGRFRLRQRPGPDNALGTIKFVMRNPYDVYLHATPEQQLFQRSRRTFSHGCIRVSEPLILAEYVLKSATGDWNETAIRTALAEDTTRRIALREPVHVIVLYSTAAASESGTVMFYEDIYGYDRTLRELLTRAHP